MGKGMIKNGTTGDTQDTIVGLLTAFAKYGFLSVEEETGIGNVVVMPDVFDANKLLILGRRWLMIEGPVQNVDNVIHVRAKRIEPLGFSAAAAPSHDFVKSEEPQEKR